MILKSINSRKEKCQNLISIKFIYFDQIQSSSESGGKSSHISKNTDDQRCEMMISKDTNDEPLIIEVIDSSDEEIISVEVDDINSSGGIVILSNVRIENVNKNLLTIDNVNDNQDNVLNVISLLIPTFKIQLFNIYKNYKQIKNKDLKTNMYHNVENRRNTVLFEYLQRVAFSDENSVVPWSHVVTTTLNISCTSQNSSQKFVLVDANEYFKSMFSSNCNDASRDSTTDQAISCSFLVSPSCL